MSRKKWFAVVAVVAVVALFVPLVPLTTGSGQFFGGQYQRTEMASPTYYAFHCGSYVNPQVSVQLASGFSGFYQLSKGYTFACYYNSAN